MLQLMAPEIADKNSTGGTVFDLSKMPLWWFVKDFGKNS